MNSVTHSEYPAPGALEVYDSSRRPHPFVEEWRELYRFRDLVAHWSVRNVTIRYKRSILGVVWTLIEPMDRDLSAPVWLAEDGKRVAYVRHFRVRSPKMIERLQKVAQWAKGYDHNSILPLREIVEIEGVSQVSVQYTRPYEISIEVSEEQLRRYGLTLSQVAAAVRAKSIDTPGGT